jgi:hypothetical protein
MVSSAETTQSRDNQIATSHGRPRAINPEDSNVRPLRTDDFELGDEDAPLFMHFVAITSLLGDMTEHYRRGTLTDRKKIDFEQALTEWLKGIPTQLRLYHPDTKKLNSYDFKVRQLHVLYFAALIILFRHEKRDEPPTSVALLAASFISGTFEEYLTNEDISHLSVTSIFYLMATALLQLSYHRFPSLACHRTQELEIVKLSLDGLKKRFPTALGAERILNQMTKQAAAALPDPLLPARMRLTPEQKELFAPFGPELCRMWTLVFDPPTGIPAALRDFSGQGPVEFTTSDTANGAVSNSHPVDQASANANEVLQPWNNDASLNFPEEELGLFSNEQNLDSLGRWWWADWVPEADLDFLSKSL